MATRTFGAIIARPVTCGQRGSLPSRTLSQDRFCQKGSAACILVVIRIQTGKTASTMTCVPAPRLRPRPVTPEDELADLDTYLGVLARAAGTAQGVCRDADR